MFKVIIRNLQYPSNDIPERFEAIFETKEESEKWIEKQRVKRGDLWKDFHVKTIEETQDTAWRHELQRRRRSKEYPKWEEVMEAIVENMEGRPEKLDDVIARRAIVRNQYPF